MFIYSRIRDTFIRDTLKYTMVSVGISCKCADIPQRCQAHA